MVMLSWFSFWLDLDAIPGRVALLVTSMLTLVTIFTDLKNDIPPVAYIKVNLRIYSASIIIITKSYNGSLSRIGIFSNIKIYTFAYTGTRRLDGWLHDVRVRSSGRIRRSQGAQFATCRK